MLPRPSLSPSHPLLRFSINDFATFCKIKAMVGLLLALELWPLPSPLLNVYLPRKLYLHCCLHCWASICISIPFWFPHECQNKILIPPFPFLLFFFMHACQNCGLECKKEHTFWFSCVALLLRLLFPCSFTGFGCFDLSLALTCFSPQTLSACIHLYFLLIPFSCLMTMSCIHLKP